MSLTVSEVYQKAKFNLNSYMTFQLTIGKMRLRNYEIAIKLGAKDNDDWNDWKDKVEEYKNINAK